MVHIHRVKQEFRKGCEKYSATTIPEPVDVIAELYDRDGLKIRYARGSEEYILIVDDNANFPDDLIILKKEELQGSVKKLKSEGKKEAALELEKLLVAIKAEESK